MADPTEETYGTRPAPTTDGTQQQPQGLPVSVGNPLDIAGADRVLMNKVFYLVQTGVVNAVGVNRQQLGIEANSIRIDNPTGQWYFEPSSQQWIPPYWLGVVLRCPKIEVANLTPATPTTGASRPVAGETTIVVYEATRFEPSPGYPMGTLQSTFVGFSRPNAATQASAAIAAVATRRAMVTALTISLSSSAGAAAFVDFDLIETASGTRLWGSSLAIDATAGAHRRADLANPVIIGALGQGLTLRSTGAPPANVFAAVSFFGQYIV